MNFIQIFQTQSFRNFVENIIEAEYNIKIYHTDMNLTFRYIQRFSTLPKKSTPVWHVFNFINRFLIILFNQIERRKTQKHPTHFSLQII